MESFGERLRRLRTRKDMSLDALAAAASLSKAYLWKLEKKQGANPSLEVARRLADVLGVPVSALVAHEPTESPAGAAQSTEIPKTLREAAQKLSIPDQEIVDLAGIRFRGGQPTTADDWIALYLQLKRAIPEE